MSEYTDFVSKKLNEKKTDYFFDIVISALAKEYKTTDRDMEKKNSKKMDRVFNAIQALNNAL